MARNYRSSRNNDVAGKVILSIVLVVVLLGMIVGGAVAGWFAHKDGWFDKKKENEDAAQSGAVITPSENGVKLSFNMISAPAPLMAAPGEFGDTVGVYEITATVTGSHLAEEQKSVTWELNWDEEYANEHQESTCKDEPIANYATHELKKVPLDGYNPQNGTEDVPNTVVITFLKPFDCAMELKAVSAVAKNLYATCKIDYKQRTQFLMTIEGTGITAAKPSFSLPGGNAEHASDRFEIEWDKNAEPADVNFNLKYAEDKLFTIPADVSSKDYSQEDTLSAYYDLSGSAIYGTNNEHGSPQKQPDPTLQNYVNTLTASVSWDEIASDAGATFTMNNFFNDKAAFETFFNEYLNYYDEEGFKAVWETLDEFFSGSNLGRNKIGNVGFKLGEHDLGIGVTVTPGEELISWCEGYTDIQLSLSESHLIV